LTNMALIAACRRLGIRSMDVQHGVQGDLHVAYGRWVAVPSSGWELLPDRFWCWSQKETLAISRWSPPTSQHHKPVVGGNLWLQLWKSGADPRFSKALEQVARLCERRSGCRKILVTLQWGISDEAYLLPLAQVIRATAGEFNWWLRLHPLMRERTHEIGQIVGALPQDAIAIREPTDLPLLALLGRVDAHLTYSSSVVLEASEFGIASVVSGEYGSALYADEIAAGTVLAAPPVDEGFVEAIRTAASRHRLPPTADVATASELLACMLSGDE